MFKLDIANKKGQTFHIETDSEIFVGLKVGDSVNGKDIKAELEGYEFVITGASDKAGFPALAEVEGTQLKRVLLRYGKGMRERKPRGLRKRKTIRGNTISLDIVQINLSVKKSGAKSLNEIFGKPEPVKKEKQAKQEEQAKEGEEKQNNGERD